MSLWTSPVEDLISAVNRGAEVMWRNWGRRSLSAKALGTRKQLKRILRMNQLLAIVARHCKPILSGLEGLVYLLLVFLLSRSVLLIGCISVDHWSIKSLFVLLALLGAAFVGAMFKNVFLALLAFIAGLVALWPGKGILFRVWRFTLGPFTIACDFTGAMISEPMGWIVTFMAAAGWCIWHEKTLPLSEWAIRRVLSKQAE